MLILIKNYDDTDDEDVTMIERLKRQANKEVLGLVLYPSQSSLAINALNFMKWNKTQ